MGKIFAIIVSIFAFITCVLKGIISGAIIFGIISFILIFTNTSIYLEEIDDDNDDLTTFNT